MITIKPHRQLASDHEVVHFLVSKYQQPGTSGNPLINAEIHIVEQTYSEAEAAQHIADLERQLREIRAKYDSLYAGIRRILQVFES